MSKFIKFVLFAILSLPKTVYFNFKVLPFKYAIKLPILIGWHTKILGTSRGVIDFSKDCKVKTFMIRLGFGGSETIYARSYEIINIDKGSLTFLGQATFAAGSTLDVSGKMIIGHHFSTNKNAFISCSKEIIIGNNVMLGWNVVIYDAAGHTVYYNGIPKFSQGTIKIGNHVWLCSESHLLKGAEIGNGSIVGWRSIVTNSFLEDNVLIVGSPGIIKQHGISWGPFIQ